jgi:hypothetical protein
MLVKIGVIILFATSKPFVILYVNFVAFGQFTIDEKDLCAAGNADVPFLQQE